MSQRSSLTQSAHFVRQALTAYKKGYSQRRACALVGLHPKTYRYASKRSGDEEHRVRLRELASQRRRFGYRRLGLMLKRQGNKLNPERLYRLYKGERPSVRKRVENKSPAAPAAHRPPAT